MAIAQDLLHGDKSGVSHCYSSIPPLHQRSKDYAGWPCINKPFLLLGFLEELQSYRLPGIIVAEKVAQRNSDLSE